MTTVRGLLSGCVLPCFAIRSTLWRGAMIGIVCALICWGLNGTVLMRNVENWLSDASFSFRGCRASAANVIIVDVDEASLEALNKPLMFFSPELAGVIAYLHERGAAAIGVDFLLPAGAATMEDLQPGRRGDMSVLGQAVGAAGNVVLPEWFLDETPRRPPYEWYDQSLPSELAWADLGFVDLVPDDDSCLRRQRLRITDDQGVVHPSMALALIVKAQKLSQGWLSSPSLLLGDASVPMDADDCLPINYAGPVGTIRVVPFGDVLAASRRENLQTDKISYKNAIVLIGTKVGTFQDRYCTPYTFPSALRWLRGDVERAEVSQMSGVEVHANVVAMLMDRAFLTTPRFVATPILLLLIGGLFGAILTRCSLEVGALAAVIHHIAWRSFALGAFCLAGWRVEQASMLLLGVLVYATVFAMRWRWIRRMMGMVKSEAVARALEAGGARLDLRGQQRDITVLFCDIRDFTSYSERHTAEEVVRLLNAFFTTIVPAIELEHGTVNQYIGDAVMVIFGAPAMQTDHAFRAVRTAREMVARVHAMSDRWRELDAPQFRIGVGIHTGPAVVGTVGSPRRLDYTAIGDTVNTASRIESGNKEVASEILISQATFLALPHEEQLRIAQNSEPRNLVVKGKQESLVVYAV